MAIRRRGVDDEESEVEVLEEGRPEDGRGEGPRVLKVPRAPTQREIDAHMATHLPHVAWCDICMKGRGGIRLIGEPPVDGREGVRSPALQKMVNQSAVGWTVQPPLPGLRLKGSCMMGQSLV